MELVISDAHHGLKDAIATVFSGAAWQRCRTHFMTNLLTRVPKRAQPEVATLVRTISQQITPEEAHAQLHRMVEQLREPSPKWRSCWRTTALTSWPSLGSRWPTSRSCGPTTRWSA